MLNSQNSLLEWFSSSSSPKHWLFMASLSASFYLLAPVNHEQISFMPDILLHFDRYRDRNLFHPSGSSRFLSMFYIPNTIWIAPHANKGYLWSVIFYGVSIGIMFELLWKLPFWATAQIFLYYHLLYLFQNIQRIITELFLCPLGKLLFLSCI